MVPTLYLVLVFWKVLVVEYFHSNSVVALGATVILVCRAELCFCAKYSQPD